MFNVGEDDSGPVLQYSVEVSKREPPNGWHVVPSFVSGPPKRPVSKEAFYSKLGQTPDASLPKVEQLVEITFRQEATGSKSERGSGDVDIVGEQGGVCVCLYSF